MATEELGAGSAESRGSVATSAPCRYTDRVHCPRSTRARPSVPNTSPSIDGIETRKVVPSLAGPASAATSVAVDVRSTRLVDTGPSYLGRVSAIATSLGAAVIDARSTRLVDTGPSYVARLDFVTRPNTTVVGVLDVIAGATQFPVSAGKTIYIGLLEDASVSEVEIPMPAGQVLEVVVESDTAPGVDQSFAYDVLKNGTTTGLSVSIPNTSTGNYNTGTLAYSRRDRFALRLVTSAGAASAKHKFSVRYLVSGG